MIRLRQGFGGQVRLLFKRHPGLDPGSMSTRFSGFGFKRRCSWVPTSVGMTMGLLVALFPMPLAAQTIAITGGRVVIGDGSEPIEGGRWWCATAAWSPPGRT